MLLKVGDQAPQFNLITQSCCDLKTEEDCLMFGGGDDNSLNGSEPQCEYSLSQGCTGIGDSGCEQQLITRYSYWETPAIETYLLGNAEEKNLVPGMVIGISYDFVYPTGYINMGENIWDWNSWSGYFNYRNFNENINTIQIEIKRSLYMDEVTLLKKKDFELIQEKMSFFIKCIEEFIHDYYYGLKDAAE